MQATRQPGAGMVMGAPHAGLVVELFDGGTSLPGVPDDAEGAPPTAPEGSAPDTRAARAVAPERAPSAPTAPQVQGTSYRSGLVSANAVVQPRNADQLHIRQTLTLPPLVP